MGTKVIIDSFDSHIEAVAFTDWLRKQFDNCRCKLCTLDDVLMPCWDGVDTAASNKEQIVINITVDSCSDIGD